MKGRKMKQPKGNYMKMPRELITAYKLTQGELYLYYVLKEFEQRYCNQDNPYDFFVSDAEILRASGLSHNTMAKYKRALKEKGLIRVRKRRDNKCSYRLNELY